MSYNLQTHQADLAEANQRAALAELEANLLRVAIDNLRRSLDGYELAMREKIERKQARPALTDPALSVSNWGRAREGRTRDPAAHRQPPSGPVDAQPTA